MSDRGDAGVVGAGVGCAGDAASPWPVLSLLTWPALPEGLRKPVVPPAATHLPLFRDVRRARRRGVGAGTGGGAEAAACAPLGDVEAQWHQYVARVGDAACASAVVPVTNNVAFMAGRPAATAAAVTLLALDTAAPSWGGKADEVLQPVVRGEPKWCSVPCGNWARRVAAAASVPPVAFLSVVALARAVVARAAAAGLARPPVVLIMTHDDLECATCDGGVGCDGALRGVLADHAYSVPDPGDDPLIVFWNLRVPSPLRRRRAHAGLDGPGPTLVVQLEGQLTPGVTAAVARAGLLGALLG
jgi:hypothetical protein